MLSLHLFTNVVAAFGFKRRALALPWCLLQQAEDESRLRSMMSPSFICPKVVDAQYTKNHAWRSVKNILGMDPPEELSLESHCQYKNLFNYRAVEQWWPRFCCNVNENAWDRPIKATSASNVLKRIFKMKYIIFCVELHPEIQWIRVRRTRMVPWCVWWCVLYNHNYPPTTTGWTWDLDQ